MIAALSGARIAGRPVAFLTSSQKEARSRTLRGRQSGLGAVLSLPVDQHRLLPPAGRLVGAMDAPRPAARPFLPLAQFVAGSMDAALARRRLLRIIDPADELVAAERAQLFPEREEPRIRSQRRLKIVPCLVHRAMRKSGCHETPACDPPTGGFIDATKSDSFGICPLDN